MRCRKVTRIQPTQYQSAKAEKKNGWKIVALLFSYNNSEITVPTPFVAHDLIYITNGYVRFSRSTPSKREPAVIR